MLTPGQIVLFVTRSKFHQRRGLQLDPPLQHVDQSTMIVGYLILYWYKQNDLLVHSQCKWTFAIHLHRHHQVDCPKGSIPVALIGVHNYIFKNMSYANFIPQCQQGLTWRCWVMLHFHNSTGHHRSKGKHDRWPHEFLVLRFPTKLFIQARIVSNV